MPLEEGRGREQQHRQAQHPAAPVEQLRQVGLQFARRRPRRTAWPASSPASCRRRRRTAATAPCGFRRGAARAPARRHRGRRRSRHGAPPRPAATAACAADPSAPTARCPAALTVAAATPSTPHSACSMMPAQAAQYMPDRLQRRFGHALALAAGRPAREALLLERVVQHRDVGCGVGGLRFEGGGRIHRCGPQRRPVARLMIDNLRSTRATLHEPHSIELTSHCAGWGWHWAWGWPGRRRGAERAPAQAGHRSP